MPFVIVKVAGFPESEAAFNVRSSAPHLPRLQIEDLASRRCLKRRVHRVRCRPGDLWQYVTVDIHRHRNC